MRFTGRVAASGVGYYPLDVRLTSAGTVLGTLTEDGRTVRLMVVDGRSYVIGDRAFWTAAGAGTRAAFLTGRWVRLDPDELGIDTRLLLVPEKLGELLAEAATAADTGDGGVTTVKGVEVREVRTSTATVAVTTATPHRIIAMPRCVN
jgi:hypothetical protein